MVIGVVVTAAEAMAVESPGGRVVMAVVVVEAPPSLEVPSSMWTCGPQPNPTPSTQGPSPTPHRVRTCIPPSSHDPRTADARALAARLDGSNAAQRAIAWVSSPASECVAAL